MIENINLQDITVEYLTSLMGLLDQKFAISWPGVRTKRGVIVLVSVIALNGMNQHNANPAKYSFEILEEKRHETVRYPY